jgi:hypothetical protein
MATTAGTIAGPILISFPAAKFEIKTNIANTAYNIHTPNFLARITASIDIPKAHRSQLTSIPNTLFASYFPEFSLG